MKTSFLLTLSASIITYAQASIIQELQLKKAIPTFTSIQKLINTPDFECSLHQNVIIQEKNNELFVIADNNLISFTEEILAQLYAYSIGFNTQKGHDIVKEWSQWSALVPEHFLELVKNNLVQRYSFFEQRQTDKFPEHTLIRKIDTGLIDNYCSIVEAILSKPDVSEHDISFVNSVSSLLLLKGTVFRTCSGFNKWISSAKQSIVKTLNNHALGQALLTSYAKNPIIASEIDAYTQHYDF